MDTVQNIANVVVGSGAVVGSSNDGSDGNANVVLKSQVGGGHDPTRSHGLGSAESSSVVQGHSPSEAAVAALAAPSPVDIRRRPGRSEFLSRPNWLFTHNENVLFCTALNSLRFPDQNNVPRKFIEEWLADRMITMDTQWPAGSKFLSETINQLGRDKSKFEEKRNREIRQRQREFHKNRKQALLIAERNYKNAKSPEVVEKARQEYEEAKIAAEQSVDSIEVQAPSPEEIALVELQTKIVRRLQGQTDRLSMAEHLHNKPYEEPAADYFKAIQDEVLAAIEDKHQEIAEEREKVETKSKQSRKRRRNQVANGITMSGSATRVRFTNREIAMLIHWIYSYPKNEWSQRIYEYYIQQYAARSAEHVRDKMRDLINRSRDTERGGLASMKTRTAASFFGKTAEPLEVMQLAQHDLQDFKFPEGPLQYVPGGRYFDEERCGWVDGPLPKEYIVRYHEEIARIWRVVKCKVMRTREHGVSLPSSPNALAGSANTGGMYDLRLVSAHNAGLGNAAAFSDPEFQLASREMQEAFLMPTKASGDLKDAHDDVNSDNKYIAALASAALKSDSNDQYLHLVQEAQDSAHGDPHGHVSSHLAEFSHDDTPDLDLDGDKDHLSKKSRTS